MANVDAMVQEGVASIKAGRKADARNILEKAVELDEHNEQAWLWLSACVESLQEQQICLENVLAINPGNTKAQKGLDAIVKQLGAATAAPPAPFGGDFDPFSVTDPYSDPTAAWGNKFDSSPATSVDWGRGSAPTPGSGKEVRTPSPEDLDNWMANLPITKSKPEMPTAPVFDTSFDTSFDPSSGPFGVSDNSLDSGKNTFGASSADPFGKSNAGPSPFDTPPTKSADPFDFGDLPASFGNFDNFGTKPTDAGAGSKTSRNDPFGTDFGNGSSSAAIGGSSNTASSADRFKFGSGSGSEPAANAPRSDPFSLPKAEPITGRRKATELPGSSSLFRDKDDQAVPDDMDDLRQQAGIFGGGSSSALKTAKSTLGISSSDPAFRGIPDEIQADRKSGGGSTRTLLILGVLNVISLIALVLLLKG